MGVTPPSPPPRKRSREEAEIEAMRRKIRETMQAAGVEPGQFGGQTIPPPERRDILDDEGFILGRVRETPEQRYARIRLERREFESRIGFRNSENMTFRYDDIGDGGFSKGGIVSRETFPSAWRDRLAIWWLTRENGSRPGWVIRPLSVKLKKQMVNGKVGAYYGIPLIMEGQVNLNRDIFVGIKDWWNMRMDHLFRWRLDALAWAWLRHSHGTMAISPPEVRISHE